MVEIKIWLIFHTVWHISIFINSTAGGIMPIKKIDDQTIDSDGIGPVTKELHQSYWLLHEDPQYNTKVGY